jgi:hypothetical protein
MKNGTALPMPWKPQTDHRKQISGDGIRFCMGKQSPKKALPRQANGAKFSGKMIGAVVNLLIK